MPCLNCNTQFTIFKRKKTCSSCKCYYCINCLGKSRKNICTKCEQILVFSKSKSALMQIKTKDLVFFLQSRKINIAGIVEKEELCNLIINHLNNNSYYEGSTTSSASTPNDFDNYAQSFDQIKQTCQSLFTSITDKITSDFQKTTCFSPSGSSNSQRRDQPHQQPSNSSVNQVQQQQPSTSDLSNNQTHLPKINTQARASNDVADCECSDNEGEMCDGRISEKRESIMQGNNQAQAKKRTKLSNSDSSFEEVFVVAGKSEDDWLLVQKAADAQSSPQSPDQVPQNPLPSTSSSSNNAQRRRRSDSDLNRIIVDVSTSSLPNIKVSCRKCGRAKSKIKQEILKLSEQLKSSNRTEAEINEKIKEFIDYIESMKRHESSETEESHDMPNSPSHDEIEENVLDDENEGINVYASTSTCSEGGTSQSEETRRFISLDDISSSEAFETMNVKQLKEILMLNRVDFRGCCEKNELKERVMRLWESHKSAPPPDKIITDDLCKICMDAPIECVFLECGHSIACTACGKILSECPICRSYIVRVVRIFKS